ncbi:hypothetical protein NDU88_006329 [Pleurodeles waltl]|uniref:Uncharacterized protein n=1 Tax=Pleurodeles waltl TaxID=8319 RepID=A0AAV7TZ86_PLEWA|nr:hypothetical protein NDU88_006329 [Pleurodeles waltl]
MVNKRQKWAVDNGPLLHAEKQFNGKCKEPSTSWGTAGILDIARLEDEPLDYDKEGTLEEGGIVEEGDNIMIEKSKASVNGYLSKNKRSVGVLQKAILKTVQYDLGGTKGEKKLPVLCPSVPRGSFGTTESACSVVVPDPDVKRSGTYPATHPGDEGLCKVLLVVARERRGEEEAADGTKNMAAAPGPAAVPGPAAAPGSVALQETAALPESAAAPGPPATRQKTAALQEAAAADADTRTWCPTRRVSLPQLPGRGTRDPATLEEERGLGRYNGLGII